MPGISGAQDLRVSAPLIVLLRLVVCASPLRPRRSLDVQEANSLPWCTLTLPTQLQKSDGGPSRPRTHHVTHRRHHRCHRHDKYTRHTPAALPATRAQPRGCCGRSTPAGGCKATWEACSTWAWARATSGACCSKWTLCRWRRCRGARQRAATRGSRPGALGAWPAYLLPAWSVNKCGGWPCFSRCYARTRTSHIASAAMLDIDRFGTTHNVLWRLASFGLHHVPCPHS